MTELVAADISPPTDDRPFFFLMADLGTFRDGGIWRDDHITRPVLVLALLAATVLVLAASCVALPLALGRRRGSSPARGGRPFTVYFAGIGLGFLLLEVAQLQRLAIFLGHPVYGLSVVLATVLVFSGIGSMVAPVLTRRGGRRGTLGPLVALVAVVAATGALTVPVLRSLDGATMPLRIVTAVALLAPMATLMGMPFSIGMRAAVAIPGTPTAYLWGVNGAMSVCASVLGVVIALFVGITAAFWCGFVAYIVALAALAAIAGGARVGSTNHIGVISPV